MNYYDGLDFLMWAAVPQYVDAIDKRFGGYYSLQFNYSGPMRFSMEDDDEQVFDGPCAYVSAPHRHYTYGSVAGQPRNHRWVSFCGDRVSEYIEKGLLLNTALNHPVHIVMQDEFAHTMDELFRAIDLQMNARAVQLLEQLLLQMHTKPRGDTQKDLTERIEELAQRMAAEPQHEWQVDREAEQLCISTAHFRRLFKQHFRMSPGKFLQLSRMRLAARILTRTQESVTAVAQSVGIADVRYFSRLFSRHYQLSPARFRKRHHGTDPYDPNIYK